LQDPSNLVVAAVSRRVNKARMGASPLPTAVAPVTVPFCTMSLPADVSLKLPLTVSTLPGLRIRVALSVRAPAAAND
jgi:hypothetical protein